MFGKDFELWVSDAQWPAGGAWSIRLWGVLGIY